MKYSEANPPLQCIMTHSTNYQQGTYGGENPYGFVVHSTGVNNPNVSRYVQAMSDENNYQYLNLELHHISCYLHKLRLLDMLFHSLL